MVDPWKTLGIAPTDDVRRIKKAYAARVKRAHPEDDPHGFQELRQAYEMALAHARWHKAQLGGKEVGLSTQGARERARNKPPAALSDLGSQWAAEAAAILMAQVQELYDDPGTWASEDAWGALLTNESLWNVDTRQQFERDLIALLVRNQSALPPAVWCLLERQFRWTEQALSLYRFLPREGVDWLLKRIEYAPIERAEQLYTQGRYREGRALLEPIALGRPSSDALAVSARELLNRHVAAESTSELLREVQRLRADKKAWSSVSEWETLLDHEDLREREIREFFQRRLFGFLVLNGSGLGGAVWRLLDTEFGWSKVLSADDFARALPTLGPAMVEVIEGLFEGGRYQEVIGRWARVIARLEGSAGQRGRLVLERCYLAAIDQAEALFELARYREAIEAIASTALTITGEPGDRARGLLQRCGGAAVDHAERLYDQELHRVAIEHVRPIVVNLDGELGKKARLLLARCYLKDRSPGKAKECLEEVLRVDPRSVPAHLLLAVVFRSWGMLESAQNAYAQVLKLDPDNAHAEQELAQVGNQLRQAEANAVRDRLRCGDTRPQPVRADAESPDIRGPASWGRNPLWLFLALAALNSLRLPSIDIVTLMAVLLVLAVAVAGLLSWRQDMEPTITLGLQTRAEPIAESSPVKGRRIDIITVSLIALAVLLAIAVVWTIKG